MFSAFIPTSHFQIHLRRHITHADTHTHSGQFSGILIFALLLLLGTHKIFYLTQGDAA